MDQVVYSKCVSECGALLKEKASRSLGTMLIASASTLALFLAANWELASLGDMSVYMWRFLLHAVLAFTMPFFPFLYTARTVFNVWSLKRKLRLHVDLYKGQEGGATVAIMACCPILIPIPLPASWEHIPCVGIDAWLRNDREVQLLAPLELSPTLHAPAPSSWPPPSAPPPPAQHYSHIPPPPPPTPAQQQYLVLPSDELIFRQESMVAREVLLQLGFVPGYRQLRILRSRSNFRAIVTAFQAVGYMLGVAARMVEDLAISPLEAILAFLCLLVTMQLLMEVYACTHYQRPLLLRLSIDQFNLFREKVIYLPSIYDRNYWFVIEVTPRGRCIFDKVKVEILEDPSIPRSTDADDGGMEIDETDPSIPHSTDVDDGGMEIELHSGEEDEIDSLDEASEDDGGAQGLFVDLGAMGLELDDDACRDLMEDEM